MSKKKKEKEITFDFQFGIPEIIPSKQKSDEEGEKVKIFKSVVSKELKSQVAESPQLPMSKNVFIYIQQFFAYQSDYMKRDVDNMAKTMLDLLTDNGVIHDDSQVRTLLVSKAVDKIVQQNFAYLALKELGGDLDISLLRISGLQRARELFLQSIKDVKNE